METPISNLATIISHLDSPTATDRVLAANLIVDLLTGEDKLTRWGTVYILLHTPLRQYYNILVKRLQEEDQPQAVRMCSKLMKPLDLNKQPLGVYTLLQAYAHLRILLYFTAELHGQFLKNEYGKL
jgi:hypothetical protein